MSTGEEKANVFLLYDGGMHEAFLAALRKEIGRVFVEGDASVIDRVVFKDIPPVFGQIKTPLLTSPMWGERKG